MLPECEYTEWVGSPNQEVEMKKFLIRLTVEEDGQDLIEYALLAGFIALASTAMITNIGTGVNAVYTAVNTEVAAAS